MSALQTEEQQVEELKRWWKENGKSVIAGAVLGLALVGGIKGWFQYQQQRAEGASNQYSGFLMAARGNDLDGAKRLSAYLATEFGRSAYAVFAALEMAKLYYEADQVDAARGQLQWVIEHADDPALRDVARLRLGRLFLDAGDLNSARAISAGAQTQSFAGGFRALDGDIAAAAGDTALARQSYQEAMALDPAAAGVLRMKLADLGE